jgi:hypothetical protein
MLFAVLIFFAVLIVAAALFSIWPYLIVLGLVALALGLLYVFPLAVIGLVVAVFIVAFILDQRARHAR